MMMVLCEDGVYRPEEEVSFFGWCKVALRKAWNWVKFKVQLLKLRLDLTRRRINVVITGWMRRHGYNKVMVVAVITMTVTVVGAGLLNPVLGFMVAVTIYVTTVWLAADPILM